MDGFTLNKEYPFSKIEAFTEIVQGDTRTYGNNFIIGESFITIRWHPGCVVSFILTGYNTKAIYKCIYLWI